MVCNRADAGQTTQPSATATVTEGYEGGFDEILDRPTPGWHGLDLQFEAAPGVGDANASDDVLIRAGDQQNTGDT